MAMWKLQAISAYSAWSSASRWRSQALMPPPAAAAPTTTAIAGSQQNVALLTH